MSVSCVSSGSEDEAPPEQVSFNSSRVMAGLEAQLVADMARKDKELVKKKRRERQELFKKQKIDKEHRRSSQLLFTDSVLDQIRTEEQLESKTLSADPDSITTSLEVSSVSEIKTIEKKNPTVVMKSYKSLNINVKSLNHVLNPRRMAAADFKSKRFSKIHRENVQINQIHEEKLRAGGKM